MLVGGLVASEGSSHIESRSSTMRPQPLTCMNRGTGSFLYRFLHYSAVRASAVVTAQPPNSAMMVEFVTDKWIADSDAPVAILIDRGSPYVSAPSDLG